MLIGHYAAAFAAKKAAPRISLGILVLSAQLVDLLWPLFLMVNLEHVRLDPGNTAVTPLDFYDYPFSHSLVGAIGWSLLSGLIYYAISRYGRGAWIIGTCVFSHWILDFISHRPDLPLSFGESPFLGLGLWNSVLATLVVESLLFAGGIHLYLRSTRAKDRIGMYGFWSLVVVLYLIYLANLFGPPPPDIRVIALAGNASWLFVLWAFWIDRHRETVAR